MKKNIFVIDLDRCIGCMGCRVACKQENNVALGTARISVSQIGPTGVYPEVEMYFLPVMCQQCEQPSCVKVCPTGASYQREDGLVLVEENLCIGCKSCLRACPYELNFLNRELRVSDKCTQCAHLQENNGAPACVKNCAGKAMFYGDVNDPGSEVSRILADAGADHVYQLRETGNKPSVRYILRHAKWVDVLPQEGNVQSGGTAK